MSSRGLRNNNPGNIRQDKDKWLGEIKPSQDPDFKQFTSMAYGYRAMFKLLNNYQKLHGCRSLSDFINRWAPPSENNTTNYISYVTRWSGVSDIETVDTQNHDKMVKIVTAMSRVENGRPADPAEVEYGWQLWRTNP